VNLACSGFVYGLSIAYMYAAMPQIKNVLLLVGETFSKFINQRDRVNFPLYGDAGTAVLVGKGEFGKSWFNLNSDGDGFEMVNIRGGHCRNPFNSDSLNLIDQGKFGALRDIDLYMDGLRVFNFAIKKVPSSINRVLKDAAIDIDLVEDVVFHQENRFMTDFLAKKLRIPNEKNHYSLREFGNTSSASIPLTIVVCKDEFSKLREAVLLIGFGAGMSWATALVNLKKSIIIELIES
jgi:3-oxoacyl-[acyl-carrier-protein] synthase-3